MFSTSCRAQQTYTIISTFRDDASSLVIIKCHCPTWLCPEVLSVVWLAIISSVYRVFICLYHRDFGNINIFERKFPSVDKKKHRFDEFLSLTWMLKTLLDINFKFEFKTKKSMSVIQCTKIKTIFIRTLQSSSCVHPHEFEFEINNHRRLNKHFKNSKSVLRPKRL